MRLLDRYRKISLLALLLIAGKANSQVYFKTASFKIGLGKEGELTELTDLKMQKNYLYRNEVAYLLNIKIDDKIIHPNALLWHGKSSLISLSYPGNIQAQIKVAQNSSYVSFEMVKISNADHIQLVQWGPYPTTIGETIGEVVGVVRNKDFAIGIQALNVKTLGGNTTIDNDIQPAFEGFTNGNIVDISKDQQNKQMFRGDVAKPMPYGSSLQAYCRNRNTDRVIENWSHARYIAPAYTEDGGVVGSKLALFGVASSNALNTISTIELKENLPHPMLDGVWGKQARNASESYLIMSFGESNLQEAMDLTKQAGLRYLYLDDPFETWGHFKLKSKEFPKNWESLKACIDMAKAQDVRIGLHTLSNFITTSDAYVSPIPDKRLAKVGYSQLTETIDATTNEIGIKDTSYFNQFANNTLKACVIGNEIIRYGSISSAAPWKLLDCQRGAFGTKASSHQANDSIGKLMDHAYKVFLGNHELDQEIAKTIARLFNETGLMQISFDGLEGCWSEGMGDYGKQLFTKTWFDNLAPELKGKVINDASNPGHFFWHIYTRMNWGEPWYAGFRESQVQLRLKNQQFFRRNLMPSMLGWFSLKSETSLEDIEWMLARGAGFNAGFGLSTRIESLKKHGRRDEILKAIKLWETARLNGFFTEAQQQKMQDVKNEFHLQMNGKGQYELTPVYNAYLVYGQKIKQPGEPTYSSYEFNNPAEKQPVEFIISLAPKKDNDPEVLFNNPSIAINQQETISLPVNLKSNQYLYCDGQTVKLYNKQWQLLQTLHLSAPLPMLVKGKNEIVFDGSYSGENGADVKIEVRCKGIAELLQPIAKNEKEKVAKN
ncbi:hypothetical protein [Flavisolibacter tropicus]|uniref:Uncharacterized protein n=1 Tax=Flavisolibacter tropicus TaxID=1492898 RepID=A0A172U2I1_9BACT|nr:hypothetical protein [Flavisolibacter tropicus]ANE53486.1 hypothetical protein SY85_13720 [Flavisolibacter tropicus]